MPIPQIDSLQHPDYIIWNLNWIKYRLTYEGGEAFIKQYLTKFSDRESTTEFDERKKAAYCPAFAKAAINEIKNGIYQRFEDIKRVDGSRAYIETISGLNGGIDMCGNSMNTFMGCSVLPELMVMGRVGIYVDMPRIEDSYSVYDTRNTHPYIYRYHTEDVINWIYDKHTNFQSVLLREWVYTYDETTGFPNGSATQYRHVYKNEHGVFVQIYDGGGNELHEPVKLKLTRLPFVMLSLSNSLLCDTADYQIALLNLASSDINFVMRANFPFYVEQYDPTAEITKHLKQNLTQDGTQATSEISGDEEARLGITTGRRYSKNVDAPSFIHPSTEPLKASMEKQEQLKTEIKLLVNLSIANLTPKRQSADSKAADERPLENGLSYIGLELEFAERQIAQIFAEYEGSNDIATIHYPTNYSLKTEEDARKEAKELDELMHKLPSLKYQQELGKRIATILLGCKVSPDTLAKIHGEIDGAKTMNSDPDVIAQDIENGLVGTELASRMRGYPEGEVEKAKRDHAERLYTISLYQAKGGVDGGANPAARGNPDASGSPVKDAKQEKKPNDN